jgi:hypothetical protein
MAPFGKPELTQLARSRQCPQCSDPDKTIGVAICRTCRTKLPPNMRVGLEQIENRDPSLVYRAIRQAVNYFDIHFQSIRKFGGGKKR